MKTFVLDGPLNSQNIAAIGDFFTGSANSGDGRAVLDIRYSAGGSDPNALVLVDIIRQLKVGRAGIGSPWLVETRANYAGSYAALLFLAGDRRIVSGDSTLFFHSVQMCIPVYQVTADGRIPQPDAETCVKLMDYSERWVASRTGMTLEVVREFMRTPKGRAFDATQALACGIATEHGSGGQLELDLERASEVLD